jgi:hypothetical protein
LKSTKLHFLSFLLLILTFSLACTKEPDQVGIGLLPSGEKLGSGSTDTISLEAYSVPYDTIRTDETTYSVVGSLCDEIFGSTTASIYTQFKLNANDLTFGTSPTYDSAYLDLPISASFGDTLSPLTLRVFKLTDTLSYDGYYYAPSTVPYNSSIELGSTTFFPMPDTIKTIKIPLNLNFGSWLINAPSSALVDNNAFTQYFKGLYITTDKQTQIRKGSMLTVNLISGSSLTLYYHNSTDTAASVSFAINSGCARFINYNHYNYKNAMPELIEQLKGNTQYGKQYLFTQSMAGPKIKLNLPDFSTYFKNKPVILNEAKLIFTNISSDTVLYRPPTTMGLYLNTASGQMVNSIPDAQSTMSSLDTYYFDSYWHRNENNYQFRITRYIQQLMLGKRANLGLWLTIPGSESIGHGLGFKGTSAATGRAKLILKYTYLDNK